MENSLHPAISRGAFARFLARLEESGAQLHSMTLYENGERLIRFAMAPYSCDDKRELYSLSKSFCSTAAGVAFDRGKLSPEDAVLDWFPEYVPLCAGDERWRRMKLRHVMTMATGHAACVMPPMCTAPDSMRAFFEQPLSMEPGERFVYNTGATCVLAEVVRRAMGISVPQVLALHVFPALGIGAFDWKQNLDGRCQGGVGLSLCCEDVARLGLLYLNGGVYGGERVLSEAWTRMATGWQISNAHNGTPDWQAGYGFQFWRNAKEGFRGDGARGQLCVVLPERGIVAAILAETDNMQRELDALWAFLDEMKGAQDAPVPAGYAPCAANIAEQGDSGWRKLEENPVGLHSVRVKWNGQGVRLWLLDNRGVQQLDAPAGAWRENTIAYPQLKPALVTIMPRSERQALRMACAAHMEDGALVIRCRCLNGPHAFDWRMAFPEGRLEMDLVTTRNVFGEEKHMREAAK